MIGYKSFVDGDLHWRDNQGGLLPLSPLGRLRSFNAQSAKKLLKRTGTHFVRWETAFDQGFLSEWWHVIKVDPENIEDLPKKTRYMIRKAAKAYEARPVEFPDIHKHGYPVYVKAYERYETHEVMYNEKDFCSAINDLPEETEWWGVFDRETGKMVAFSENYVENKTCFYVSMWLEPKAMEKFAGYLLFHEMELHYLQDREFYYISDGSRSLSHDTNIHEFLIRKFNFRKAYARLHVVYTPWLGIAVACAYPFRNLIDRVSFSPLKKASILLKQEEIRRSCAKVIN